VRIQRHDPVPAPTSGTIEFEQSGSGRQRLTQVVLELLDLSPSAAANGGTTTAQVTLTGSGTTTRCSDAVDSTSGADLPIRHGRVVFTLDTPGSDLFGSRCAGRATRTSCRSCPLPPSRCRRCAAGT